ncbi:MAG TPA: hypothetical protein VJ842_06265 [Pyrinomonadaceae bacterium]|nr:hypothetical protein [Pyrinomonadaceae bacterium]
MANISFTKYLSGFKSISGLLVSVGTLIPAYAYFTKYAPPLLEASSLLTAALAAATVIYAYYYKPAGEPDAHNVPSIIKLARNLLIISLALFIIYIILFRVCTVPVPREDNRRWQIGFNRYDWSLTEEGKSLKQAHPATSMPEFMLWGRVYDESRIEVYWKTWTIYLAGTLMIVLFILTFTLWNFGWSLLAKQRASNE